MGPGILQPDILHYVYIYGAIILVVIVYLLWRPKKNNPSRLKLRESVGQNKLDLAANVKSTPAAPMPGQDYKNAPETTGRIERQLNVIFQFNGHDFDAYEVFGVPAGSSQQTVQAAYEEILIKTDSESRKFYEVAYRAILNSSTKRS